MAKSFTEILNELANKPYDELVELTRGAIQVVAEEMAQLLPDRKPSEILVPLMLTTLAIDGNFSEKENQFLGDIFDTQLNYFEYKGLVDAHNNIELVKAMDEFVDACGGKAKSAFIIFCACFAAVDGITPAETQFLTKLLA